MRIRCCASCCSVGASSRRASHRRAHSTSSRRRRSSRRRLSASASTRCSTRTCGSRCASVPRSSCPIRTASSTICRSSRSFSRAAPSPSSFHLSVCSFDSSGVLILTLVFRNSFQVNIFIPVSEKNFKYSYPKIYSLMAFRALHVMCSDQRARRALQSLAKSRLEFDCAVDRFAHTRQTRLFGLQAPARLLRGRRGERRRRGQQLELDDCSGARGGGHAASADAPCDSRSARRGASRVAASARGSCDELARGSVRGDAPPPPRGHFTRQPGQLDSLSQRRVQRGTRLHMSSVAIREFDCFLGDRMMRSTRRDDGSALICK